MPVSEIIQFSQPESGLRADDHARVMNRNLGAVSTAVHRALQLEQRPSVVIQRAQNVLSLDDQQLLALLQPKLNGFRTRLLESGGIEITSPLGLGEFVSGLSRNAEACVANPGSIARTTGRDWDNHLRYAASCLQLQKEAIEESGNPIVYRRGILQGRASEFVLQQTLLRYAQEEEQRHQGRIVLLTRDQPFNIPKPVVQQMVHGYGLHFTTEYNFQVQRSANRQSFHAGRGRGLEHQTRPIAEFDAALLTGITPDHPGTGKVLYLLDPSSDERSIREKVARPAGKAEFMAHMEGNGVETHLIHILVCDPHRKGMGDMHPDPDARTHMIRLPIIRMAYDVTQRTAKELNVDVGPS